MDGFFLNYRPLFAKDGASLTAVGPLHVDSKIDQFTVGRFLSADWIVIYTYLTCLISANYNGIGARIDYFRTRIGRF